jgi:hypothetical protein
MAKVVRSAPGTDVVILKIFSPKNLAKKLAFLTQRQSLILKNILS